MYEIMMFNYVAHEEFVFDVFDIEDFLFNQLVIIFYNSEFDTFLNK